jgi:hypothetical protein
MSSKIIVLGLWNHEFWVLNMLETNFPMESPVCWQLKLSTKFCPQSVAKAYYYKKKKLNNTSRWDPLELLKIKSIHFLCYGNVRQGLHGWWDLLLLAMVKFMNHWFLMSLKPMLFINIVSIYSYHTFTINLLAKLHGQFWERKKYF